MKTFSLAERMLAEAGLLPATPKNKKTQKLSGSEKIQDDKAIGLVRKSDGPPQDKEKRGDSASRRLMYAQEFIAELEKITGKKIISETPLDFYGQSGTISSKVQSDSNIPESDLIFRTAENGKVYAINGETGETSGLGPGIDNNRESEKAGTPKHTLSKFKTFGDRMDVTEDVSVKASKSGKTTVTIKAGKSIDGIYCFAGKGSDSNLVQAGRLASQHGGKPEDWTHKAGFAMTVDSKGNEQRREIHWFENEDVGQTGFKVKYRPDNSNGGNK